MDDRLTRAEHIAVVRDGRGTMPGWQDDLTAEEIDAVVDYERTVLAPGADEGDTDAETDG